MNWCFPLSPDTQSHFIKAQLNSYFINFPEVFYDYESTCLSIYIFYNTWTWAFFEHSLALCFFHGMILTGVLSISAYKEMSHFLCVLHFWDFYKCFANAEYLDYNCYQSPIITNIWVLL